jgi:hypothetical protein
MLFSQKIKVFHGRPAPEEGWLAGYGAIIEAYGLAVPLPDILSLISFKNRQYQEEQWQVFTSRHLPEDTLYKQLVFALRYEGIQLLVLKKLFEKLTENEIIQLVQIEPMGQYSRKIWVLYEWLFGKKLPVPDLKKGNFVPLLDKKLQYDVKGVRSSRHRIINNLPGTPGYCPLIRKTPELEHYIHANLPEKQNDFLKGIRKDVLQRASAFLLLKDSKASFTIEGESPQSKRASRWGKIIGQAGTQKLNREEFIRLQQEVIENPRFVHLGFRDKGGFVGEHDRTTGEPLPDHISAKWQDIDALMSGLLDTYNVLLTGEIDAVLAATIIAFGFVFIHPFEDGNGRIHRYLIHHLLAEKHFTAQGMIFPVSASILDHIDDYRKTLEAYSSPLLDFIEWRETKDHNVEVVSDTIDFYRYFDATRQAEFLYACVEDTIKNIVPNEISYMAQYDEFKRYLDESFEMPDKLIALLVRALEQNSGKLSKRVWKKEFPALTEQEVTEIEQTFGRIMNGE